MVGPVDRLRALLCARQSRSLAAQLAAFDSRYCAVSAGGTAALVFLPTRTRCSARLGLFVLMQSARAKAKRRREDVIAHRWPSRTA
jgi:hypothetical protein